MNKLAYRIGEPQVGDIVMLYYPLDPEKSFVRGSWRERANESRRNLFRNRRAFCVVTCPVTRPCYRGFMEPLRTRSNNVTGFATLSDDALVDRVKQLAVCERNASVALIRSLVEFDRRRLYLREGCASLFTYCTQVLHLAEGSAYNRIETARAARRYPRVLEALERGDVTLTGVRLLAPHLTAENHDEVLAAARHRSKQGILELIASLNPRPVNKTVIRQMTTQPATVDSLPALSATSELDSSSGATATIASPSPNGQGVAATTVVRDRAIIVTPLAPDCYRLHITLTHETHDKLQRAQALARHTLPDGNLASILDRALTLLIDHLEGRRCAKVASPRPGPAGTPPRGRHIPAAVRRAVWQRDEGRCAFVGHAGRCHETAFLEFHHVAPYAVGGTGTAENIQLRCRAHNQYEARLVFGDMLVRERRAVYLTHTPRHKRLRECSSEGLAGP